MDMREILKRIDQRLEETELTDASASRGATGSPDLIRNWRRAVKDGRNPGASTTTLSKLADALKTNLPWLVEGIGEQAATELRHDFIEVPVIAWVSAGEMTASDVSGEALRNIKVGELPDGDWIALQVQGDSMDRISPPDSVIVVNRRDKQLVANACYVIADGEGNATYKRYRPDPMRFEPVSTNDDNETIFPDQEPEIVGRVRRSILDM